ncbi:MAG: GntR family transcriptional regulator [Phyllobacterium sp.]
MSTAEPAESENPLLDRVRRELREMLRSGEIMPGDRLNELHLAQRLDVGRNVAREALRGLEYTGLIKIVPNKGAEIRKLSMEEALNLYDLRAGLARTAGRSSAHRATRDEINMLAAMQDELAEVVKSGDALVYNQINIRFHSFIFEIARNPRLQLMNAAVDDELSLFLTNTHYTPNAFGRSWLEHQKIVDSIRDGNPDESANAFEQHILEGKKRLVEGQVTIRF